MSFLIGEEAIFAVSGNSAIKMNMEKLGKYALSAGWADVCKGWHKSE